MEIGLVIIIVSYLVVGFSLLMLAFIISYIKGRKINTFYEKDIDCNDLIAMAMVVIFWPAFILALVLISTLLPDPD